MSKVIAWVQATYRLGDCGCDIIGNGTLPHPLEIKRCPKHEAAPELLAACERLLLYVELHKQASPGWNGNREDDEAAARAAIAKAVPK